MVKSFSTEVADLEPVMALLCRKQVRVVPVGMFDECVSGSPFAPCIREGCFVATPYHASASAESITTLASPN